MVNAIKMFLVMYALTKPVVWAGIIALFTLILLACAVFVRFKNGWISWVSFIVFELLGVFAIFALTNTNYHTDNLNLGNKEVRTITEVTEDGVVLERRFRPKATPLLGIDFPSGDNFKPVRERILNSCFDKKLFVSQSSVYTGVVLYDASQNCINEALLREGLVYVSGIAPQQYIELQKRASESKRGIWAQPVVQYQPHDYTAIIRNSVNWLVAIQSLTIIMVIRWRKRKQS